MERYSSRGCRHRAGPICGALQVVLLCVRFSSPLKLLIEYQNTRIAIPLRQDKLLRGFVGGLLAKQLDLLLATPNPVVHVVRSRLRWTRPPENIHRAPSRCTLHVPCVHSTDSAGVLVQRANDVAADTQADLPGRPPASFLALSSTRIQTPTWMEGSTPPSKPRL